MSQDRNQSQVRVKIFVRVAADGSYQAAGYYDAAASDAVNTRLEQQAKDHAAELTEDHLDTQAYQFEVLVDKPCKKIVQVPSGAVKTVDESSHE